jgi:hypothetical protein
MPEISPDFTWVAKIFTVWMEFAGGIATHMHVGLDGPDAPVRV